MLPLSLSAQKLNVLTCQLNISTIFLFSFPSSLPQPENIIWLVL